MAEQKERQVVVEIGKKLKNILDDVLATGDWGSSLFLRTAAAKLKDLRNKTEGLYLAGDGESEAASRRQVADREKLAAGYSRVFILLYQVEGTDLQIWHRTIKNLAEYGINRPAYKDENYAKEFIRSKTASIERNGYVMVKIKDEDFYQANQQIDGFGHPLYTLKENAVKPENIIEFVHANKKRYAIRDDELVFLGEV